MTARQQEDTSRLKWRLRTDYYCISVVYIYISTFVCFNWFRPASGTHIWQDFKSVWMFKCYGKLAMANEWNEGLDKKSDNQIRFERNREIPLTKKEITRKKRTFKLFEFDVIWLRCDMSKIYSWIAYRSLGWNNKKIEPIVCVQ